MKRSVAAGVLAFAGLMTTGVGVSNADTIQTEGNYPTRQACQDAGPGVKATTPGQWNKLLVRPGSERCRQLEARSEQLTRLRHRVRVEALPGFDAELARIDVGLQQLAHVLGKCGNSWRSGSQCRAPVQANQIHHLKRPAGTPQLTLNIPSTSSDGPRLSNHGQRLTLDGGPDAVEDEAGDPCAPQRDTRRIRAARPAECRVGRGRFDRPTSGRPR